IALLPLWSSHVCVSQAPRMSCATGASESGTGVVVATGRGDGVIGGTVGFGVVMAISGDAVAGGAVGIRESVGRVVVTQDARTATVTAAAGMLKRPCPND